MGITWLRTGFSLFTFEKINYKKNLYAIGKEIADCAFIIEIWSPPDPGHFSERLTRDNRKKHPIKNYSGKTA